MEVGFSSLGSFSALFSRRVGETPSGYRRRVGGMVQVPGTPHALEPGCLSLMEQLPPDVFQPRAQLSRSLGASLSATLPQVTTRRQSCGSS